MLPVSVKATGNGVTAIVYVAAIVYGADLLGSLTAPGGYHRGRRTAQSKWRVILDRCPSLMTQGADPIERPGDAATGGIVRHRN